MLNQKKLTLPPNIGSLNKSGHDMKIALGSEIFPFSIEDIPKTHVSTKSVGPMGASRDYPA